MNRRNFLNLIKGLTLIPLIPNISIASKDYQIIKPRDISLLKSDEYFTFMVADLNDINKSVSFLEKKLTPIASMIKPFGCYAYFEGSRNYGDKDYFDYGIGEKSRKMLKDILFNSKNSAFNEFIKIASEVKVGDNSIKYKQGIKNLNEVLFDELPVLDNNLKFVHEIPLDGAEYENESNHIVNYNLMKHLYKKDSTVKRLIYNNLANWSQRLYFNGLNYSNIRLKTGTTNRTYGTFGVIERKNDTPLYFGINLVSPNAIEGDNKHMKSWSKRVKKTSVRLSYRMFEEYKIKYS